MSDVTVISDPSSARALLHPLRLPILERAREPISASQIAEQLGLPRQRVNYHVKELASAGFLRHAGSRKRRNMTEQHYVQSARGFVLSPHLLGALGLDPAHVSDRLSARHLVALATRSVAEILELEQQAREQNRRLATLALDAEVSFRNVSQRTAFTEALRDAVAKVIAEHSAVAEDGDPAVEGARTFRLVVACHPKPSSNHEPTERRSSEHE